MHVTIIPSTIFERRNKNTSFAQKSNVFQKRRSMSLLIKLFVSTTFLEWKILTCILNSKLDKIFEKLNSSPQILYTICCITKYLYKKVLRKLPTVMYFIYLDATLVIWSIK